MSYFLLHKCLPSTLILWCKLEFESGVNMCLSKYLYLYFIWFNLRYYTVLAYLDVWGLRMITCSIVLGAYNWRLCLFFDFSEIKCLWCKILRFLLRLEIFGDFALFLYVHLSFIQVSKIYNAIYIPKIIYPSVLLLLSSILLYWFGSTYKIN